MIAGLSPDEQDAFSDWLAADSRHKEAFGMHSWGWDELEPTCRHAHSAPTVCG